MAVDKDNPFFLEAGLDVSQLKDAVTKAEKFYQSFSKSMSEAIEGLESQEAQHEKTGKAAKQSAKDQERASTKNKRRLKDHFKFIKKIGSGVTGVFKREKMAIESLGISWGNLAVLIGGATVAGFIGKAIKDWLEFDSVMRSIGSSFSFSAKQMDVASSIVQDMTGYLNVSREELVGMVRAMGDIKLIRGDTAEAGRSFRELSMDIIHLSKSIDVSNDSVVGMFDRFTRIYKLPHHRLRNIAASMKYIQEQTSISGQELMSFAEGLDDVLARMLRVTGKGKAEATADLMAMAGVLKDMGVQPEKVSQAFGEAMKLQSEQGAQFLAFVTEGTDKTSEQLRKMMQAGDMQTPLTMLIERIKKETPEWLEHNEDWLTETTGMTFAELRNIQQASTQGLADIFANNRKEYIRGQKHAEDALKRQHRLSKLWNDLKRIAEKVWLKIGGVFVTVATKLSEKLVPAIEYMSAKVAKWMNSSEGAAAIHNWASTASDWFDKLYEWLAVKIPQGLKKWASTASDWFVKLYEWLAVKIPQGLKLLGDFWDKHLKDKFEWLMSPAGGEAAKEWFSNVLSTIGDMAKGIKSVAQVIMDVREGLKTDEERMTDYTTEQIDTLARSRQYFEKHIAQRLKEGGKFEYAGIEMEATPGNVQTFMAKVAKKQADHFIKGLNRYDAVTQSEVKARRAALSRFKTELLFQQKQGFGPDIDSLQRFDPKLRVMTSRDVEDTGSTGIFATPPTLNTRVPPESIKNPEIQPQKPATTPVNVKVNTDSRNQEKLLGEIRDGIRNMARGTRGQHASRVLLEQQG